MFANDLTTPGVRLVYAQQNATNKTNDVIIYNDTNLYQNAGLVIGPSDQFANLRLSYNSIESKAHVTTNTFSIDAPSVMLPNIVSSSLTTKAYKYVVKDIDGNLLEGYNAYPDDINITINQLQNSITVIEASIETLLNRVNAITINSTPPSTFDMKWIYIIIGIISFLCIICLILWLWLRNKSNELSDLKHELLELKHVLNIRFHVQDNEYNHSNHYDERSVTSDISDVQSVMSDIDARSIISEAQHL
jgi:hypothetical protein